ncbi:serine hydrolase domain-containing protein [Eubacterium sp. 1001713B170207_170306_E7]|uniref:serine hydrolase domain-containing protein n=1 Tax=Eubacterium sp. 1001713B170207_170306_E7 TaxID=2787097 RepID=UPI001899762F|nr:serine hydrolase domain-containing protein [Eubacterium sp. 1001713B170207_170306_E7]
MTEQEKFETYVTQCMNDHQAVGMAVAVVDAQGATKYEHFFGKRDQETGSAIDDETIFGLASLTKSFTCLAVLKMQEDGLLSIEDPVSDYIPEFKGMNQGEPVLIKHLMIHSGGYFPQSRIVVDTVAAELGLDEAVVGDLAYNAKLAQEGCRQVAARLDAQEEFIGRPGAYFSYCNDGYGLLSDIIYHHGGSASYADYLLEHILKPLGMERSFCDFVRPLKDGNHASLYAVVAGELTRVKDYHDNAFVLNGGGAMKSTVKDLKKYIAMYLNNGTGLNGTAVAKPETITAMTTKHQSDSYVTDYGYGLDIKELKGLKVVGHGGSLPGVSSHLLWCPEKGIGVIVLCNTEDVPVSGVAEAALSMGLGFEAESCRHHYKNRSWDAQTLEAACGVYASDEGVKIELCMGEGGEVLLKNGEKASSVIMIEPGHAMIAGEYSDTFIELIADDRRGIFGMRYGSRILPKAGA